MSGLGSFVEGAFRGYSFGEGVKDTKRRRRFEDEDRDWQGKVRDRTQIEWGQADEDRDWRKEQTEFNNSLQTQRLGMDRTRLDMAVDQYEWQKGNRDEDREMDISRETLEQERLATQTDRTGAEFERQKAEWAREDAERARTQADRRAVEDIWKQGQDAEAPTETAADPAQALGPRRDAAPQAQQQAPQSPPAPAAEQAEAAPAMEPWYKRPPPPEAAPARAGVLGQNDPIKATPEQREKGAQAVMQSYAGRAQQVAEHYMSQGDIEKAEAWMGFADQQRTSQAQQSWAKAVYSAQIGDEEALLDNLAEAYNAFDDGYTIDRAASGFEMDDAGAVTGVKLALTNQQTGEVYERRIEGDGSESAAEKLVDEAVYALSPEAQFEYHYNQLQAARQADAATLAHRRAVDLVRLRNTKDPKDATAIIDAELESIMDEMIRADITGVFRDLPVEEQTARAASLLRARQAEARSFTRDSQAQDMPPMYTGD